MLLLLAACAPASEATACGVPGDEPPEARATLVGDAPLGFGVSSSAGDLDGDGRAELVVAHDGVDPVDLWNGRATELPPWPDRVIGLDEPTPEGSRVVADQDLDGDGVADLAIGSSAAMATRGRVAVYLGGVGGPGDLPDRTVAGAAVGARLGRPLVAAGDLDGDGRPELVSELTERRGLVVVAMGTDGELTVVGAGGADVRKAESLVSLGDVDHDGLDDLGFSCATGLTATVLPGVTDLATFGVGAASLVPAGAEDDCPTLVGLPDGAIGMGYRRFVAGEAESAFVGWTVGEGGFVAGAAHPLASGSTPPTNLVADGDWLVVSTDPAADPDRAPARLYAVDAVALDPLAEVGVLGLPTDEDDGAALVGLDGDVDGDGLPDLRFAWSTAGGGDGRVEVYPGCTPQDADGDGAYAAACWGTDCDDAAPATYPGGRDEPGDGIDQDCDGYDASGVAEVQSPGCGCALADRVTGPADRVTGGVGFGGLVAPVGDVNADGFDDLVVGEGTGVRLALGSATGPMLGRWEVELGADATAPWLVRSVGDVNGDAVPDVGIVERDLQQVTIWSGDADEGLGPSIGSVSATELLDAGDLDGDGRSDLLTARSLAIGSLSVFQHLAGDGFPDFEGRAVAHLPIGLQPSAVIAGDLDGDGYVDLAVGLPGAAGTPGSVELLPGSATGASGEVGTTLQAPAGEATFGQSLAAPGDLDGDHFDDLVIAAPGDDGAPQAYVYGGAFGGPIDEPAAALVGGHGAFGMPLFASGDADGDGIVSVAYATVDADGPHVRAWCAGSFDAGPTILTPPGVSAVAWAGDVDGDGDDDLVVGDSSHGTLRVYPGAATATPGCATAPLPSGGVALLVVVAGTRRRRTTGRWSLSSQAGTSASSTSRSGEPKT